MRFIFELITNEKIEKRGNIKFKEIEEVSVLNKLRDIYENKIILIKDKCPACDSTISEKMEECVNCGLFLK